MEIGAADRLSQGFSRTGGPGWFRRRWWRAARSAANRQRPWAFGAFEGRYEQGFKNADVIVESKYTTQVQTHCALETHGLVADWKPDMLTVWASTQGTASVREELAGFFKLPKSQVRVITEFVGGGFGAKFGPGNPGVVAAALSKQTALRSG